MSRGRLGQLVGVGEEHRGWGVKLRGVAGERCAWVDADGVGNGGRGGGRRQQLPCSCTALSCHQEGVCLSFSSMGLLLSCLAKHPLIHVCSSGRTVCCNQSESAMSGGYTALLPCWRLFPLSLSFFCWLWYLAKGCKDWWLESSDADEAAIPSTPQHRSNNNEGR